MNSFLTNPPCSFIRFLYWSLAVNSINLLTRWGSLFHRTRWQNNLPTIVSKICKKAHIHKLLLFVHEACLEKEKALLLEGILYFWNGWADINFGKGFRWKVSEHTEHITERKLVGFTFRKDFAKKTQKVLSECFLCLRFGKFIFRGGLSLQYLINTVLAFLFLPNLHSCLTW